MTEIFYSAMFSDGSHVANTSAAGRAISMSSVSGENARTTRRNAENLKRGRRKMTYLQRINQLDRKIARAKERLEEIEAIKGQNSAYRTKQMEIEELEQLKSWYNKKIVDEYETKKSRYCRISDCKWYIHGKCFLKVEPINNNCEYMEAGKE